MYRIRLHGRGGQGIKTAGRILGSALFLEGFEVQDAPRYGAERRGAPIFAYVRAARVPIHERGVIRHPDLVVVADETLVDAPAAGVLAGITDRTVLILNSVAPPSTWRERLGCPGTLLTLPVELGREDRASIPHVGAICAGAATRLLGVVSRRSLERAIRQEVGSLGEGVARRNVEAALQSWDAMESHSGCVSEGDGVSLESYQRPEWVDLPLDPAEISAPDIHASATSVEVRTGLWRTIRPVIDYARCTRCSWMCSTFCPDGAIGADEDRTPRIDYDHCKGCLICVAVCPPHAIAAIPERTALEGEDAEARA